MRQLWPDNTPVSIAISGGAITHSERLRAAVEGSIRREWPRAAFRSEVIDPPQGALYIARNAKT
jgi:hypothetical protein